MANVAILVLGCALDPYPELIDTIRRTWGEKRVRGVDIYYVFGIPDEAPAQTALASLLARDIPTVEDGGIIDIDKVLIAGCPDSIRVQQDCILHKRLIAFDYLASKRCYDFVHTVCAASYIDQYELVRHIEGLDSDGPLVSGAVGIDATGQAPYVSGASMLLSADVVKCLAENRADIVGSNAFGFRDDVALGQWIAEHVSSVEKEEIMEAIRTARSLPPGSIFTIAWDTSVDFVLADANDIRPQRGVFHYHFHSDRADWMANLHERYFLHQTRSLWSDFS